MPPIQRRTPRGRVIAALQTTALQQLTACDLDPWIWDSLYPKGVARELPDE
jgi:hypothetical protein